MYIEILAIYISCLNGANAAVFAGSHQMRFARACARFLARIMRGYIYDIDYGNGGKQRGIFVLRYDEIDIGIRPILLPARSGMTPSAEL